MLGRTTNNLTDNRPWGQASGRRSVRAGKHRVFRALPRLRRRVRALDL